MMIYVSYKSSIFRMQLHMQSEIRVFNVLLEIQQENLHLCGIWIENKIITDFKFGIYQPPFTLIYKHITFSTTNISISVLQTFVYKYYKHLYISTVNICTLVLQSFAAIIHVLFCDMSVLNWHQIPWQLYSTAIWNLYCRRPVLTSLQPSI